MAAVDLPSPRTGRDDISAVPGAVADGVIVDPARGYTLWVFDAGLACCAVECAAALTRVSHGAPGPQEAGPDEAGRDEVGQREAESRETGPWQAEPRETGPGGAGPGGRAPGHGHLNVFIVAGTVTDKLAPLVLRAYQKVPDPKRVLSFGACSNSGGPYWDSYCVTKGVDQIIPVDIYVPGCPPRPEALLHGLDLLAEHPAAGDLAGRA
ncbi:MAG TPA: NADH-quinone oxidoreductase subunit NuoB [Streptosporangiaceae bacterium]